MMQHNVEFVVIQSDMDDREYRMEFITPEGAIAYMSALVNERQAFRFEVQQRLNDQSLERGDHHGTS